MRSVQIFASAIFLIGIGFSAYSQHKKKIDSLEFLLKDSRGTKRYDNLVELVFEYTSLSRTEDQLVLIKEANSLARKLNDTIRIVQSGRMIGQILEMLNREVDGEKILNEILPIAEKRNLKTDYIIIRNSLGLIYTAQAKYDKALDCYFKTLELREAAHDTSKISTTLSNIGVVFYKLKNYNRAIEYLKKSNELKHKINDSYFVDRLFINLSLCYSNIGDYSSAKEYLKRARLICNGECSSKIMVEYYYAYGTLCLRENRFEEAKSNFLKSYELSNEINDPRFQLENIVCLAKIWIESNNFSKAKNYLDKGLVIGLNLPYYLIQIEVYRQYCFLYSKTHDYRNAAKYQSKYIYLRDSIYSEELTQNLMVVQAEYEQRENKAKIESQNKELALKEVIINRQNILTIVAGVAIVLLGLLIFALYRNNQQKKAVNIVLEQKVKERTKQLEVSYELMQKAYQDQNHFISKTTNDIKSPLSTIKSLCSLGLKELQDQDAQQYLNQLNDTTDQLASMVNKLVSNNNV